MSSQSTTDRIAKAQAQAHRTELFARLRDHGQNIQVLAKVPTEGLEGMLIGLDAGKAAVEQARAQVAKARKEAIQTPAQDKPFKFSQRARRLQRMLDRSRLDSTDSDQMAAVIVLDPSAKTHLTLEGKASGGYGNAAKATVRVLYHMNLLHPDYRDELESIMAEGV